MKLHCVRCSLVYVGIKPEGTENSYPIVCTFCVLAEVKASKDETQLPLIREEEVDGA